MMKLDKVNAAQGSEMQTPYRREQLQRQIRLLEAQLVQKSGSSTPVNFVPAFPYLLALRGGSVSILMYLNDQTTPWKPFI